MSQARRETFKTAGFLAGALALVMAASLAEPDRRAASVFSDEGEAFYPQFRDPQTVKAIEVVDYDEPTATARPLKVEFRKSRWVVASNNDYPIDVGDRLVKTSAALIDLRKDQVRSDLVQDHARYGPARPVTVRATVPMSVVPGTSSRSRSHFCGSVVRVTRVSRSDRLGYEDR